MPDSPRTPPSLPWPARVLAAWRPLLVLGVAAGVIAASCSSMDKHTLRERLLALPKNRPVAEHGLERLPLLVRRDGADVETELVYLRAGPTAPADVARRPVVLVHGTPSTLCSWVEPIFGGPAHAGLAAERAVFAIEVAGHGMAGPMGGTFTFERCAEFVADSIRALGLERVHLVGSSYGGEFAWRAALNAPELVASLTLVDSSGIARRDGDFLPEEVAMRDNPFAGFGWLLNSQERIAVALAPHFPEIPPGRVEEFFLVCANRGNWRAMVDLARDENGERESELGRIAARTLVLWGRDDLAYEPEHYARKFAASIPTAELVLVPTGHYPHEQDAAGFVAELTRFFAEVER